MKVIVLPSGSVIADSWTPLFTVSIAPETKPLPARLAMWPARSSTAKFSRAEPAPRRQW